MSEKNYRRDFYAIDFSWNNKISFLDILPPKKSWRVNDKFFSIARLFVDIAVLGEQTMAQKAYEAASEYSKIPPKNALLAHEIHAAVTNKLFTAETSTRTI